MTQHITTPVPVAAGTLTVGGRELSVGLFRPRAERAVWTELKDAVAAAGDAFARAAPALDRLRAERKEHDWHRLALACAHKIVTAEPPSDDLVEAERGRNPAVLAREIHLRARPFHPDLSRVVVEGLLAAEDGAVAGVQFDLDEVLKGLAEGRGTAPADPAPSAGYLEARGLLNVPAVVTIGDRLLLPVESLSLREERALAAELAALVEDGGDAIARVAPVLDRLEKEKRAAERGVLLQVACQTVAAAAPVGPEALDLARRTNPRVLARELYHRARKGDPKLDLRELEAVITAANVGDVWRELDAALTGGADGEKK